MRIITVLFSLIIILNACLYTLSKSDIESPQDTIKTLQWTLNKISNNDFILYFEELFTGQGKKIPEKIKKLSKSKETEDKNNWKNLKSIFSEVIIKIDKISIKKGMAKLICRYFFPQNYYIQKVEIEMLKTSDGWQITSISPLKQKMIPEKIIKKNNQNKQPNNVKIKNKIPKK